MTSEAVIRLGFFLLAFLVIASLETLARVAR